MEVLDGGGFALAARVGRNGGRKRGGGAVGPGEKINGKGMLVARIFFGIGPVLALVLFLAWRQFCRVFFTSTEMQSNKIEKFVIVFYAKVVVQLKLGYTSQTSLESFQIFVYNNNKQNEMSLPIFRFF